MIIAAAAAVLAACTKTTVVYDDSETAIGFSPVNRLATKTVYGPADGQTYNTDETFGVFAYHKVTSETAWADFADGTAPVAYISKGEFAYHTGTDNIFGGVTPYYWPKTGLLAFAGYSPYTPMNNYVQIDANATSPFIKFDNFIQGTYNYSDGNLTNTTVDAMWFDLDDQAACNLGTDNQDGNAVAVAFKHACSWIDFTLKRDPAIAGTDMYFLIEKVELTNIYTKGTFSSAGYPAAEEENKGKEQLWDQYDGSTTMVLYEKSGDIPGYQLTHISGSALECHDLIAIPQQINRTGEQIEIKITYKQYPVAQGSTPNSETVSVILTNETDPAYWYYGKHYIYNITMGLDEILISPAQNDWTDEQHELDI